MALDASHMEVEKDPIFSTHPTYIYFGKTFHVKCLKRKFIQKDTSASEEYNYAFGSFGTEKKEKLYIFFILFYNLILFANCCELHYLNFSISHESNEWIHIIMVSDPNQFTFSVFILLTSSFYLLFSYNIHWIIMLCENCIIFIIFFSILLLLLLPVLFPFELKSITW